MKVIRSKFLATPEKGEVTGIWVRPKGATHVLALAHAAGTSIEHPSMGAIAEALYDVGIATFRYNFPYMEKGGRGLDGRETCTVTVRAAVAQAIQLGDGLPVLAGGRSFGGRMTSTAAAATPIEGLSGIVFYAFPLHPAKRPGIDRADHLFDVDVPMFFLSGTRDALADLELLEPIVDRLPNGKLKVIDTADHSFKVLKRSGMSESDAQRQAAQAILDWVP